MVSDFSPQKFTEGPSELSFQRSNLRRIFYSAGPLQNGPALLSGTHGTRDNDDVITCLETNASVTCKGVGQV